MSFSTVINKICILIVLFFVFSREPVNSEIDVPLPDDLEPLRYDLVLLTDVESLFPKFKGCVHITVRCVKPTDKIILNQNRSSIETEKVRVWEITDEAEVRISIVDHGYDVDEFDRYAITLTDYLKKDSRYKITIDFSKNLASEISAYNYVPYENEHLHPDITHIAYTRMNEINARTIFPNLDSLRKKVTFSMKIAHDASVKAMTNSAFVRYTPMDYPSGWVMEEFAEIKNPISTFSVGLAVVGFESITEVVQISSSNGYRSNVEIRVSAEENVLKLMVQTLRIASKIFVYFSKFFNGLYDLDKLDLVVLPDSRIDILGYYGLIFLGKNDTMKAFEKLHDEFSPLDYTYIMASKVCHAVSAQWIGHATTMSSRNNSWLHVGLNKFLEKSCIVDVFPNWGIHVEHDITNSFLALLQTEERGYFSPIVPMGSDFTSDKNSANNETISKVHHTIRMLSFILRTEKEDNIFQKSIRTYLEEYRWKNSDLNQVWKIFTSTANEKEQILPEGITVQQIMESWLGKKGHPLVKVSRNTESNKIIVTQEPFDSSEEGQLEDGQKLCWITPLAFSIKNDANEFQRPRVREWLKCDGEQLEIDAQTGDWILFNMNLEVPARVSYDLDNWSLIEELLRNDEKYASIEVSARMHLISDLFAIAEADKMSYEFVFNITKHLTHEKSYQCWQLAYEEIMKIRSRWLGTKLFEPFQKHMLDIVRTVFNKEFKSIEEFHMKSKLRVSLFENTIVKIMCTLEDSECQTFGEQLLKNWYENPEKNGRSVIPEDLVESIYCLALKNADEKMWDFFYTSTRSNLNVGILNALGCSSDVKILNTFKMHGTYVMRGNIQPLFCLKVFESLLSNKLGYELIMDFLRLGIKNLSTHLLHQGRLITVEDILAKVYEATKTNDYLKKLDSYYSQVNTRIEDKATLLEESKSKAVKNMSWLEKNETNLLKYFENVK